VRVSAAGHAVRVPRSLRLYRKGRVLALGLWSQVRKYNLTVADPQPSADTRPVPKPARSGAPGEAERRRWILRLARWNLECLSEVEDPG